jgi:hypothetical protein
MFRTNINIRKIIFDINVVLNYLFNRLHAGMAHLSGIAPLLGYDRLELFYFGEQ